MRIFAILLVIVNFVFSQTIDGSFRCSQNKIARYQNKTFLTKIQNNLRNYDVLSYKIEIDLRNNYTSPQTKAFTGSVQIKLKFDTVANYLEFDASNNSLAIDSIKGKLTSFTHSSNILKVNLDKYYTINDTLEFTIYYVFSIKWGIVESCDNYYITHIYYMLFVFYDKNDDFPTCSYNLSNMLYKLHTKDYYSKIHWNKGLI